jgi:hypothetical protein
MLAIGHMVLLDSNTTEDTGVKCLYKSVELLFRRGVKQSVPCRKILRNVKEPIKYEKKYFVGKSNGEFSPSFSYFATRCLCGWERTIDQKMVTVFGTPCTIPPRNIMRHKIFPDNPVRNKLNK